MRFSPRLVERKRARVTSKFCVGRSAFVRRIASDERICLVWTAVTTEGRHRFHESPSKAAPRGFRSGQHPCLPNALASRTPLRIRYLQRAFPCGSPVFVFIMSLPTQSLSLAPQTCRVRLILLRGVVRRFLLNVFRPSYVRASLSRRTGACQRCGVCCHLVANKCGALQCHPDGSSSCRIYSFYRLPNCCTFPIDARDLAERDLVAPHTPCGFSFREK